MALNLSDLLTRIKLELGIYGIALPVDNLDGLMTTIIKKYTLRDYSQFFPQYDEIRIPSSDIERRYYRNLDYIDIDLDIPDTTDILEISEIYYDASDISGIGYYGAGMPLFSPNMLEDVLTANIGANITNTMMPKILFKFTPPKTVRIYNLFGGSIYIRFSKCHDISLTSIPFSQELSFTELAILDCKRFLYNICIHYNEIETAHGRIGLKLDGWQEAVSKREEIIKDWSDIAILDRPTIYYA